MAEISYAPLGIQPSQTVDEYDDDWYLQNLRFIASRYNALICPSAVYYNGALTNNPSIGTVYEYLTNLSYVYGTQVVQTYGFFVKDYQNQETAVPMMRGLDVKKIFDYVNGTLRDIIEPLPKTINVTAYSENAVSAKKTAMDYVKFQIENKVFLKQIEIESGFGFKAVDRDFKTQDEVDKYFESFQESMEIAFQNIAKHCVLTNRYKSQLSKCGDYVTVGNLGMFEVEYKNGRVEWTLVSPECAIVDYTKGDDQHYLDDYGGRVFDMTLQELFSSYDWTETERNDLQAIAQSGSSGWAVYNTFSTINGLNWWSKNNGVPKVTGVKGQWRSLEKQEDGTYLEKNREGVLIANKYVKKCKISEGQVSDKDDKSRKRLKYVTVTPNTMMGNSVSIVGVSKRLQDLKDAFSSYLIGRISTSLGKVAIVRASKLPEGMNTPTVISQLKQARIVVIEGEDIDEIDDKRMAESIDLTLDPQLVFILQLIQYYDATISDVLNIPPNVRGQLGTYQPTKVVEQSQAQSTKGMGYYYKNMAIFFDNLISYSANLMKIMAPDDELGRENLALQVGDGVVELLSMDVVRKAQFEDFLTWLDATDVATEYIKQDIKDYAKQLAPTGMTNLSEYVSIMSMDSLTEIRNFLQAEEYKKKQEKKDSEQAALDNATKNAQISSEGQKAVAAQQAQTTEKLASDANQVKLELGHMKAESEAQSAQLTLFLEEQKLELEKVRVALEGKKIEEDAKKPEKKIEKK